MKKTLMIAAMVLAPMTANAGDAIDYFFGENIINLPANSLLNDSPTAKRIPNPFAITNIDLNSVLGAAIGGQLDPRGYSDNAYANGKRPNMNAAFGNMRTGKCYSDPKAGGVYCP